jgi:beta-lactam-binding protein with PASTA domain
MKVVLGAVWAVLAVALTACGGDTDVVMPDVTAKRLDVAISDIERVGVDDEVEVLGGGTFGVVDESNWTVCDQQPSAGGIVDAAPRLTVDRSCDDLDDFAGAADEPGEEEPEPESSASVKPKAAPSKKATSPRDDSSAAATKSQPREDFVMPRLVGMNLQDAQDTLQALDSYILTQTDATGMERFQVIDSGWKVCYQRPVAGTTTPLEEMVDLGVVKLDESCS